MQIVSSTDRYLHLSLAQLLHAYVNVDAIMAGAGILKIREHLGHSKNELVANDTGNTRNGKSKKTLKGDFGSLPTVIPRDRQGTFEPRIITKYQTRWTGFDDKILWLYSRESRLESIYNPVR